MRLFIFIFAVAIGFAACKGNARETQLLEEINHGKPLTGISKVLVIPGEGCPGCISDAADFATQKIDSMKNIMVIFTRVLDRKLLKLKFPNTFLTHERVRIDTNNVLNQTQLLGAYPVVFHLKNGSFDRDESFTKETFIQ
jgi:hypothetical protein